MRSDGGRWRWAATGRFLKLGSNRRDPPCTLCGRPPTEEGHDACLGEIPAAISACCGHGVVQAHVKYLDRPRHDLPGLSSLQDLVDGRYPYPIPRYEPGDGA